MSTESIKQALEDRDQAMEAKFAELAGENGKLSKVNQEHACRLVELEQRGGGDFDTPPDKHAHSFGKVIIEIGCKLIFLRRRILFYAKTIMREDLKIILIIFALFLS